MGNYFRYFPVFLLLANVILLTESTENVDSNETRRHIHNQYNEVIDNITRVNKVLTRLVRSYEQLKKLYEIGEELEVATEINIPTKSDVLPTQTFEEPIKESETEELTEVKNTIDRKEPPIEALKDASIESPKSETKERIQTKPSDDTENKHKRSKKFAKKTMGVTYIDFDDTTEGKEEIAKYLIKDKRHNTRVWLEVENKPGQLIPKRQLHHERVEQRNENLKAEKEEPSHHKAKAEKGDPILHKAKAEKRDPIYYKVKAKKGDVITNATIIDIDLSLENSKLFLKEPEDHKTSLSVIITSTESEDDKVLENAQEKTKILRAAYGEACMKLVVKKCYKACKKASKSVCRIYRCKSGMKKTFTDNAKTCCISEFGRSPLAMEKDAKGKFGKGKFRADHTPIEEKTSSGFMDMTREGYIEACLPTIYQESQISGLNASNDFKIAPIMQLNILRDKYERACAKISSDKCRQACDRAADETCSSLNCKKRQLKSYKKACKRNCKAAYRSSSTHSHSRSRSSSGSGSRSESDSGSSRSDGSRSDRSRSDRSRNEDRDDDGDGDSDE